MTEMNTRSMNIQNLAVDRARLTQTGLVHAVGTESVDIISRLDAKDSNKDDVGNILRRTCQAIGGTACQAACARRGTEAYECNEDQLCADRNLVEGLGKLGIEPEDVLMVAVTGNGVGFGDQLDVYKEAGKLKTNPEGFRELPGFNAFFARASEVPAIGSRLADCAHLEFEFKDSAGSTVIGFEHGTRTNMFGQGAYAFDIDGRPVSYTEYALSQAIEHYGADPAGVQIRLSSSIRAENFVKHFDDAAAMENHIPGWQEAGYVYNASNPDWLPGQPVTKDDIWHADARGLILHDIYETMQGLGIPKDRFVCNDMLDPADTKGEFSSHQHRETYGDSRDLYLVAHQSAITS